MYNARKMSFVKLISFSDAENRCELWKIFAKLAFQSFEIIFCAGTCIAGWFSERDRM